jgi:hypothetical protein
MVSYDTNENLHFSFVNAAILLEIRNDIGEFKGMTPLNFFLASPLENGNIRM